MEFTDEPLNVFGTTLIETQLENKLGFKTPMVFRILKELQKNKYLPSYGCHMAELCLEEALANAMVHGNKLDESKNVTVSVFGDHERFGVIVQDEGDGFGPEDLPDLDDPEQMLRERGRGILIMDHYMDAVRHNRNASRLYMLRTRQTEPDPGAKPPSEPRLPDRVPESGLVEAVEIEPVPYQPPPVQRVDLPDELMLQQPEVSVSDAASESIGPITVRQVGDVLVAEIHVLRIAEETVSGVRQALIEVADRTDKLVLDLVEVEFMASVGISALVVARKKIAAKQGQLIACRVQPAVENVLKVMGLLKLIPVEPDCGAALAKLGVVSKP